MSNENPMLRRIQAKLRYDRDLLGAFEEWFKLNAARINPLMTKEDAREAFYAGFELGGQYNLDTMAESLREFIQRPKGKPE